VSDPVREQLRTLVRTIQRTTLFSKTMLPREKERSLPHVFKAVLVGSPTNCPNRGKQPHYAADETVPLINKLKSILTLKHVKSKADIWRESQRKKE